MATRRWALRSSGPGSRLAGPPDQTSARRSLRGGASPKRDGTVARRREGRPPVLERVADRIGDRERLAGNRAASSVETLSDERPSRTNTRYPGSTYSTRESIGRSASGRASGEAEHQAAGAVFSRTQVEEALAVRQKPGPHDFRFAPGAVRLHDWDRLSSGGRDAIDRLAPVWGEYDLSAGSPGPGVRRCSATSQIGTGAPPERSARQSLPAAKKPRERPSGDQKREFAFSVPGIARASSSASGRSQILAASPVDCCDEGELRTVRRKGEIWYPPRNAVGRRPNGESDGRGSAAGGRGRSRLTAAIASAAAPRSEPRNQAAAGPGRGERDSRRSLPRDGRAAWRDRARDRPSRSSAAAAPWPGSAR